MLLPVNGSKVNFDMTAPASTDTYVRGLRWNGAAVRANTGLTVHNYTQGLPVDANGVLCLIDATAGLPAGTKYQNGFPLSASGICISTNPAVNWQNGMPMAGNGAVCA